MDASANEVDANEVDANEVEVENTPLTNIKLLQQYIRALTVNIQRDKIPSTINLIFDSGAVNGVLGIGAAIYINNLEQIGYLKVKKVSGCSIGSLIALWYVYDCPEEFYNFLDTMFIYYKKYKNFYIFENIVRDVIYKLIKDPDDMTIINDRLYINYYDTLQSKNCVISQYQDREHLIKCILRSSHVPFLTSTEYKYEGRYIDGIVPFIFNDEYTNLFVKLIHFTDPLNCMNTKSEQNIYCRLLRGVVGVNEFFVNGDSKLCSYVNDASYLVFFNLSVRKQIVLFVIFLIEWTIKIKKHIPVSVKNTDIYKSIMLLSKSYWSSLQNNLV
jgi:hypothetical protein